jgi:cytochrome c biogenesis factor
VLRAGTAMDLRVSLDSTDGDLAHLRVIFAPLAGWLWFGAALLVFGAVAAMLPVGGAPSSAPGGVS